MGGPFLKTFAVMPVILPVNASCIRVFRKGTNYYYTMCLSLLTGVKRMSEKKTYGFPALLSFFVPGLGQIIKGQVVKAVVIWLALGISWLLQFILIGFILLPLIWLWQIYDAYNN
jgi:TM2 domain-containing membrane protein YozV